MHRVLIVDDEEAARDNIAEFLNEKGYFTRTAANGKEALDRLRNTEYHVVLLDIRMPEMDGITALSKITSGFRDTEVIMVTALSEVKVALHCLKNGAFGYITKPVDYDVLEAEIEKAHEHRRMSRQIRDYQTNLEEKVEKQSRELRGLYNALQSNFYQMIRMFIDFVGLFDPFLSGHSKRVGSMAIMIGRKFNLTGERLVELEIAALLHDIGSISLPAGLLEKDYSKLTVDEIVLLRKQTVVAETMLGSVDKLKNVAKIIRSHLEWINGHGYPDELSYDDIPLESRIISVCHGYDEELHRDKKGEKAKDDDEAENNRVKEALTAQSGKKYDAKVVKTLLDVLKEKELKRMRARSVSIYELKPGIVLARNIYSEKGRLLFSKDHSLTDVQLSKLKAYHNTVSPILQDIYVYEDNDKSKAGVGHEKNIISG